MQTLNSHLLSPDLSDVILANRETPLNPHAPEFVPRNQQAPALPSPPQQPFDDDVMTSDDETWSDEGEER